MGAGFGRRIGWLAAVCSLLLCTSGCFCWPRAKHGLVLRGDWSLELNRAPWLANRSESYQEASPDCVPTLQSTAAGVDFAPMPSPGTPQPTTTMPHSPPPPQVPQRPAAPLPMDESACRLNGGRCISSGGSMVPVRSLAGGPPQEQNVYRHPSFHPVPSQPVFSRREGVSPPGGSISERQQPPGNWASRHAPPSAAQAKPKRLAADRSQPEDAAGARRSESPRTARRSPARTASRPSFGVPVSSRSGGAQMSWIFTPPEIRHIPPPNSRVR